MTHHFDLLEAPWIPCTLSDGTPLELGLREALVRAREVRELYGESALVTASLHRLLLAVLHRAYKGPVDCRAWEALWNGGRWDEGLLTHYLDRWRHRFDLFDPQHPFFQARDAPTDKSGSINRLVHEMAHGNNATLFDHHVEEDEPALTPAQAARAVVALQAFGLGGFGMGRSYHADAPCTGGIVFLIEGDNLFETLALNLLRYPDETLPGTRAESDRPVWEMDDPFTPERSVPLGYLDYLTWQNRRILLFPEKLGSQLIVRRMSEASAPRLTKGILDPMHHYVDPGRGGPRALTFREGRALWRDSATLFQLDAEGFRPPRAFDWLAELAYDGPLEPHQTRRYLAVGMSKRQAKVNFYRTERMPLPMQYLRDSVLVSRLTEAIEMAEMVQRQLWGATRRLATLILSPEADTEEGRQPAREDVDKLTSQWAVDRHFWSKLDTPFMDTMQGLPVDREAAMGTWQTTLKQAAWAAFARTSDQFSHDAHKLKAVVRSRGQLAAGLGRVLSGEV